MTSIHFFSESGFMPMKDAKLKSMIDGSHGWQADGAKWVFGVVHVKEGIHPLDVVDHMASLGITVLPSVLDIITPIDSKIYAALAEWIAPSDRTHAIATKMGKLHPSLRPSIY